MMNTQPPYDESRYCILFEESPISLWEEDFSAVKRRVDELCERHGRDNLARYLEQHPEVVRACGQQIRVLDVNRTTLRLYNAPSKEALLKKLDTVFGEDVHGVVRQEMLAISRGEQRFEGEGVNYKYTGEPMNIILQWAVATGYAETYGKVFVSIQDNTRRKLAESRLEAMFQNERIGITLIDRTRHYLMFNQRWAEMTGYAPEELRQMDFLEITHPDDREFSRHNFEAIMQGRGAHFQLEKRYIRKDGSIFWSDLTVVAIPGVDGSIDSVFSFIVDITERRQALDELAQAQKLATLGTVAAGVAHEINTPLQVITGISDSILNSTELIGERVDTTRFRQKIEMISRNSWRVAEIVNSLQDYARPSAARFEPVNLNELIVATLQQTKEHFQTQANIFTKTELTESLPLLVCDREKIVRVITNLLTNARDAMPLGGSIHVYTAYDAGQRCIVLSVSDNGHGIPSVIRDKIFDPFYTTKEPGAGVGLGLSVVQGIVRLHGGKIAVESKEGDGTKVSIFLPEDGPQPADSGLSETIGRYDDAV